MGGLSRRVCAVVFGSGTPAVLVEAEQWTQRLNASLRIFSLPREDRKLRSFMSGAHEGDLIITPHPRRGDVEERVALEVLRAARSSLLFTAGATKQGEILAATDLSDPRLPALGLAWKIAKETGRKLTTLHCSRTTARPQSIVFPLSPFDVGVSFLPVIDLEPMAALRRAHAKVGIADAAARISTLPPASAIAAMARELQAELLVMGAHHRSWFTRLLLGSTCESVLRRVSCSVMVVPLETAS